MTYDTYYTVYHFLQDDISMTSCIFNCFLSCFSICWYSSLLSAQSSDAHSFMIFYYMPLYAMHGVIAAGGERSRCIFALMAAQQEEDAEAPLLADIPSTHFIDIAFAAPLCPSSL